MSESDHRWRTKDGILIEHDDTLGNYRKGITGAYRFWSRAACAVFDNVRWTRCVQWKGGSLTITLPEPRHLTGVRFIGSYRRENYTSDHTPSMLDYKVYASKDGRKWDLLTVRDLYIPEEEGPQWAPLYGERLKAVRVHMRRNIHTTHAYERGVSFIELFEGKQGGGRKASPAVKKAAFWTGGRPLPGRLSGRADVVRIPPDAQVKSGPIEGAAEVRFKLYLTHPRSYRRIYFHDPKGRNTIVLHLRGQQLQNHVNKPVEKAEPVAAFTAGVWHDVRVRFLDGGTYELELDGKRHTLKCRNPGKAHGAVTFFKEGADLYLDAFSAK